MRVVEDRVVALSRIVLFDGIIYKIIDKWYYIMIVNDIVYLNVIAIQYDIIYYEIICKDRSNCIRSVCGIIKRA